ncbi:MAG: SecY-interacting protein [Gammaproteobacteria bacterium]|nr:MAG: SecY-interacting protein [Gammaproteobacteria bacterium]
MISSNQAKTNLVTVLQNFSNQYISQYQQVHSHLPLIEQDVDWPSPCEVFQQESEKSLSTGQVFWQPVIIEKNERLNFDNVESALELTLHQDIKTYFTTLYSESLDATCEEGELSLLFAWNKDDFNRLQENLIGHVLMKQRMKQKETLFFAVTDEEDMIISIDNETGSVCVERVGCEPHKKVADSLAQFISQMEPKVK